MEPGKRLHVRGEKPDSHIHKGSYRHIICGRLPCFALYLMTSGESSETPFTTIRIVNINYVWPLCLIFSFKLIAICRHACVVQRISSPINKTRLVFQAFFSRMEDSDRLLGLHNLLLERTDVNSAIVC